MSSSDEIFNAVQINAVQTLAPTERWELDT
jgi:hypothetical protein